MTVVFAFIFTYLNYFEEINMKNAYFSKKIIKIVKEDRQLGIYASPLGKKNMCFVIGIEMPPFISSNSIRKKTPVIYISR